MVTDIEHPSPESSRDQLASWQQDCAANAFDGDALFQGLLQRLSGETYQELASRLREVAATTGEAFAARVTESSSDANLPVLRRHDSLGRPREEVVFHPAYHEVGEVFWHSGVLEVLADPGNEVLSGALAYLLGQHGEAGHACPVACTAGAVKLLQQVGSDAQRRHNLPALLDPNYSRRLHAAQFVTEVQGGSDVGLNACRADPITERPGWYRITGEKWFCSVADAGLFVVSARPAGAPEGTRGLGLFLVPRHLDGTPNGFTLRRLKEKLGTRSMATGEIEFDGALGEAIGPLDQGFKNLVGIVLDTSRVHNALAACGISRRALVVARSYAERRTAFEHPVAVYPAVQETLARIRLRGAASLLTTFRILAHSDQLAVAKTDPQLQAARRIDVMVNKYRTATHCSRAVRHAIEVLGGNGTIEDFSELPRLYRDAIVLESWEGTHNTLCAQVLRDFADRGLHRPWLACLRRDAEELRPGAVAEQAGELLTGLADRIEQLLAADAATAAAHVRHTVDQMCQTSEWLALARHAQWEQDHAVPGDTEALLRLHELTELDRVDPRDCPEWIALQGRVAEGR